MKPHWMEQTYLLVDEIKADPSYQRLLELHKQISTNEEIQSLIQSFKAAQDNYTEVQKYGKYHPDLKKVRTDFSEAKMTLYTHPMVAEYKSLEQEIQLMLDDISKQLATAISPKIKFPNDIGIIPKH